MSISVRQPRGNHYGVIPEVADRGDISVPGSIHFTPAGPRLAERRHLREVDGKTPSSLASATGIIVGVSLSLGLWGLIALALWLA